MLSGHSIKMELSKGDLIFSGIVRGNSLLLTLGSELLAFRPGSLIIEPDDADSVNAGYELQRSDWKSHELTPQSGVLISAKEYLRLPSYLAGAIGTISHVARLGLFAHYASPFIGPRYSGRLCLEIFNASGHVIRLKEGLPIAKVVLFKSDGEDPSTGVGSIPFYYNSSLDEVGSDLRSKLFQEFKGGQRHE